MKETKVFQRTLHRQLWMWLSENQMADKKDWVGWVSNGGTVDTVACHCFACAYANGCEGGRRCPLEWSLGSCVEDWVSEYDLWRDSENPQERSRLARVIAELPVKDGVVCE